MLQILIVGCFLLMATGCAYRNFGDGDAGWVNIAHGPETEPYYWSQIAHVTGDKLK